jgi:aspartyl/asparaginyl-tRNA synthetase
MQKGKIVEKLEIEADQLEWLKQMAQSYSLPDASKALRVVLDHAMEDADEDRIFMSIRCRRCG